MADPNPYRLSWEDPTLCRVSHSEGASPTDAASRTIRPSIPVRLNTISNANANAAASPHVKDSKDVCTQTTDTRTREVSDPPQRVLCIQNIQAKLSLIEQAIQNTIACQHEIQNRQCEIRKDFPALKELKSLEIIRRTKSGEEDLEGLQGKGVEKTNPNIAIPHPAPPRHLTQIEKDQKAINAYFSNCKTRGCHQGDAAGLVTTYLAAQDTGALDDDQLAILAIRVSKMLQGEQRGGIWATVISLWLNDCGAGGDETLDRCVVDAVRNMLEDQGRVVAIRGGEGSKGGFEKALRGYGEQMRKRRNKKKERRERRPRDT
ncbi:MAG: hypothetical protein LQ337_001542 [Flavoplaca oasis]|nr:MAG: hypothetical protein LQ337_001542 [Flavoplaca oasis]